MPFKGPAQTTFKDDFDSAFNANGTAPKGWLCYGTNAEARVQISTEPPSADEPFTSPNALYLIDRSEKENPLAVRNVSETMQGELALDLYVPPDLSSCVFIYFMGKGFARAYLTLQGGFPYLSYTTNALDVVTVGGGPQTMPCKTVRLPAKPSVKMRGWNHVVLRQSPQGFHASINGSATNCTDGVYKMIDQVRIQVGSGDTANHWNYVDNVSFSIPQ